MMEAHLLSQYSKEEATALLKLFKAKNSDGKLFLSLFCYIMPEVFITACMYVFALIMCLWFLLTLTGRIYQSKLSWCAVSLLYINMYYSKPIIKPLLLLPPL